MGFEKATIFFEVFFDECLVTLEALELLSKAGVVSGYGCSRSWWQIGTGGGLDLGKEL